MLAGYRRVLRPGGRLLIDHANLPILIRRLPPGGGALTGVTGERGDDFMLFHQRYDPLTGRMEMERLIVRGGRVDRHPFSIRYFTFAELRDWLLVAGFTRADGFAGDGGALTIESGGMIVVAKA